MARHTFPDDAYAAVFSAGMVAGANWTNVAGARYVVYNDAAATQLADIRDPITQGVIPGSVLTVSNNSMLPKFLGTDGAIVLYIQPVGGGAISSISARISEILPGPVGPTGPTGPAGPAGVPGPTGPIGPTGGVYLFTQMTPATTWTIAHNLGFRPNVQVFDSAGSQQVGDIHHIDINNLTVTFSAGFSGEAHLS